MSRGAVHLEVITRPANESDPDSEGYILCGIVADDPNLTLCDAAVTCKRCLRQINRLPAKENP